jgi:hypothetical protein
MEKIEKFNQIIDEAYRNYLIEDAKVLPNMSKEQMTELGYMLSKEDFICKIKTNAEFAEKWGLTIEGRELSTQERNEWYQIYRNGNNPLMKSDWKFFELDQQNIPTKVITLTYNNQTIESYE